MPFESEAQRRFMYAKHPKLAKEFQEATPKDADLPEHVKKMADGGVMAEPDDKKFAKEVGQGINEGINHDSDAVRSYLSSKFSDLIGSDKSEAMKADAIDAPDAKPAQPMAEGGSVMRSSLEHQVPNAMMARPMAEGGYPHVTFLENVKFPEVKKTVHLDKAAPHNASEASTGHSENYSEGGYPHVTFLENESPDKVQEDVHMEPKKPMPMDTTETGKKENPPHMAEGGAIHKAEDRDKEPAKPVDADMSHEKKLAAIYKAMGVKKYADGGYADGGTPAPANSNVDASQLPNPNDPSYWDTIKAALAQIGAPVTAPAGAVNNAAQAIAPAVSAAAPAGVAALNNLTGANLPVPPPPAPAGAPVPLAATAPTAPAPVVPPALPLTPSASGSGTPASAPNLNNLFNQDTSKLTEGVNPSDRQNVIDTMNKGQRGLGSMVAEAISGLGDAVAAKGGMQQHSLKDIFSMQQEQRAEALANFDKARQDRLEKLDLQTKMGNNAVQTLAAKDAYGTDENLNKILGAPAGTAHKDLPLYMQMMSAKIAQQEKDTDLYMKAHAQAANDVDTALKNAGMFNMKPSPAQIQASGAKLADQYYNKAKGNILFQPSDGQKPVWIPAQNIGKAQQMDPHGQTIQ